MTIPTENYVEVTTNVIGGSGADGGEGEVNPPPILAQWGQIGGDINEQTDLMAKFAEVATALNIRPTALAEALVGLVALLNADSSKSSIAAVDRHLRAPTGSPTPTAGAAGNLTGTFGYAVLFVLADGTKSSPWGGTASTVTVAAKAIDLNNIPVSSDSRVVARELYRTKGTAVDIKDYYLVTVINNNTATTYTDNLADANLGAPLNWLSTANWHFENLLGTFFSGLGMDSQALAIGFNAKAGYASMSIGYEAGKANTTGRRNIFHGQYAGTSNTTGYQNTFLGVHAGQNNTTGWGNTFIGCYAGYSVTTQEENVAVGNLALGSLSVIPGRRNTTGGDLSMGSISAGINSCTAWGYAAGKYMDASYQVAISAGLDRANATGMKNDGLIFGQEVPGNTPAQFAQINGATRLGTISMTVATLTTALPANANNIGRRAYVNDSNVAYAGNAGATVAGGGSNVVPVFCNGTNWVIG